MLRLERKCRPGMFWFFAAVRRFLPLHTAKARIKLQTGLIRNYFHLAAAFRIINSGAYLPFPVKNKVIIIAPEHCTLVSFANFITDRMRGCKIIGGAFYRA